MARGKAPDGQQTETVRRELAAERRELAEAVHRLRSSASPTAQLRSKLPLVMGGAFAAGFVLSGGIGAAARLIIRRGREGHVALRFGRYALVRT